MTRTGQVVGTPSYMAPEQAQGRVNLIGPTSDIYSLGAILYSLLVGRPPFRADSVRDKITSVIGDEPVAPRSISSGIPKDLETICLKCLDKEHHRRYQSGKELADELTRFLNHEPILARPISATARTIRWCRRNQKVASLLVAFVSSLVLGAGTATYYGVLAKSRADTLEASNESLKLANKRETELAKKANESAEFSKRQSTTIMTILEKVMLDTANRLGDIPDAQEARREILKEAMKGLELISEEIRDDNRAQENHLRVLLQMADIYGRLGDEEGLEGSQKALQNFKTAQEIAEQLVERNNDPIAKRHLVQTYLNYVDLLIDTGRMDEAFKLIQVAVGYAEEVHGSTVGTEDEELVHTMYLYAQNLHGEIMAKGDRFDDAIKIFDEAIVCGEELVGKFRNQNTIEMLAKAFEGRGDASLDGGHPQKARPFYEASLALSKELTANDPTPEQRWQLSISYERMGELYRALNQNEKALEAYEASYREAFPNYQLHENDLRIQLEFAITYCKLAKANMNLKRPDKVIEAYSKALDIRLPIAKADPTDLETQRLIINSYQGIGVAYELKQDFDAAISNYESAKSFYEQCAPEAKEYLRRLERWLIDRIAAAKKAKPEPKG